MSDDAILKQLRLATGYAGEMGSVGLNGLLDDAANEIESLRTQLAECCECRVDTDVECLWHAAISASRAKFVEQLAEANAALGWVGSHLEGIEEDLEAGFTCDHKRGCLEGETLLDLYLMSARVRCAKSIPGVSGAHCILTNGHLGKCSPVIAAHPERNLA